MFYNNQVSYDGSVKSSGDDRTGGNSDGGDDESLTVDLDAVDPRIKEIIFVVSIYECFDKGQHFGQVDDAYIRIVDEDTGREIARYQLDDDFDGATLIEFGKLVRKGRSWEFIALGNAYKKELDYLVDKSTKKYISGNNKSRDEHTNILTLEKKKDAKGKRH